MVGRVDAILREVSEEFNMPQDELLKQGIRTLLERRLREVKSEIFEITGKYGVSGVEGMESRYREGTLEEADSWRDLQSLDHLEYKRDRLVKLLEDLS
jgi:hypothetical protein